MPPSVATLVRPNPKTLTLALCAPQIAKAALLLAACALATGHLGSELNWRRVHMSWYAARAPMGGFITLGMWLSVLGMVALATQVFQSLRPRWWSGTLAGLFILSALGLSVLALYEVDVSRRVHNLGLLAFFFTGTPALFLTATTLGCQRRPLRVRLIGLASALMTASGVSIYLMWRLIPLERGLRQRAAFLCLWLAAMGLLWALKRATDDPQHRRPA